MKDKIRSIIKKLGRFGYKINHANKSHIDPVCGMEASSDLFQVDYKGESYYFCSDHCKERFVANPDNYAK